MKKNIDNLSIELLKLIRDSDDFEWLTLSQVQSITWINHSQKLYNRLEKLIKYWYITEDYEFIKMPDENTTILPFFWWAQCGHSWDKLFEEGYPREKIEVDINELPNKNIQKYFISRAKWKSMEPLIKSWNNLLIKFHPYFDWESYNYLVSHNWKAKVKQIKNKWNKKFLVSLNENYPPLEIKENDQLQIIWVVENENFQI